MAKIKVGSFSSNRVTGNQAITGVGFQPKAVIFWHQREWSDGGNNAYDYCFGTATSPTARWVSSSFQSDFNDEAFHKFTSTRCIWLINHGSLVYLAADFVSMDSDGFTINITDTDGTARTIFYMAIGGADVSAFAGNFNSNTATGSQAITGVGFQPKATLFSFAVRNTTEVEDLTKHGKRIFFFVFFFFFFFLFIFFFYVKCYY